MKKRKMILIFLAVAAVSIFLLERIFFGLREKLRGLNQQIRLEEKELRRSLEIQKEKDAILKDYEKFQPYLKIKGQGREIIGRFLKELERIAYTCGVSIVNLTPGTQVEETKDYKKYKAELKAEADLEEILDFIYKIQNSRLLTRIEKFSLTPKNKEASVLTLEATISIAVL